jgi:hypothetical protein
MRTSADRFDVGLQISLQAAGWCAHPELFLHIFAGTTFI